VVVDLPTIEFCDNLCALSIEDSDEVYKYILPNTKFEFVHEVHNKEREKVQPELGED
jgi:hypothetical protein